MTTKQKKSKKIGKQGVNIFKALVEKEGHLFQVIEEANDIGNDAYIEFIREESASGFCMAVQIKTGVSYLKKNGAVFKSDKAHFEYWSSHVLPIAGIVCDPIRENCFWCDIKDILERNPDKIKNGPYTINISKTSKLDSKNFNRFYEHFIAYKDCYESPSHLGEALSRFAERGNVEGCFDGMMALFSFHRNKFASWYYLISSYRNFKSHPLLLKLTLILSHIPGHMDIFWSKDNFIPAHVIEFSSNIISEIFSREDVEIMLSVIKGGFARGSIGQAVHAILHLIPSRKSILESIAFDSGVTGEVRYWALLLLITYSPKDDALRFISLYKSRFSKSFDSDEDILLDGIYSEVEEKGKFLLYI